MPNTTFVTHCENNSRVTKEIYTGNQASSGKFYWQDWWSPTTFSSPKFLVFVQLIYSKRQLSKMTQRDNTSVNSQHLQWTAASQFFFVGLAYRFLVPCYITIKHWVANIISRCWPSGTISHLWWSTLRTFHNVWYTKVAQHCFVFRKSSELGVAFSTSEEIMIPSWRQQADVFLW